MDKVSGYVGRRHGGQHRTLILGQDIVGCVRKPKFDITDTSQVDFGDKVLEEAKNAFTRLLDGETFEQVALSGSNSALRVPDTLMNLSKVREYIGPSLMREAQLLKPGQFSEPKKVSGGYKIIYLVDREDATQPKYSNIRSSVLSEFSKRRDDQSLRTYLDNLKK